MRFVERMVAILVAILLAILLAMGAAGTAAKEVVTAIGKAGRAAAWAGGQS